MCSRIGFSTLSAALLLVLPTIARADSFTYSFNSDVAHFSFTEPGLLATGQTLFVPSLKLQGATFVYASLAFLPYGDATSMCFMFGTANVTGNCASVSYTEPYSFFNAEFLNATSVGTYVSIGYGCAHSDPVLPCIDPYPQEWTLTISRVSAVPEPSSLVLFGSGALGLIPMIRRKLRA